MAYPYYINPYNAYQTPQVQQIAYQSGIIWVENGYQEAVNYPMAPNTAIPFWDRHADTIYLKQSDAAGRQTIRILDYKERTGQEQALSEKPVTKEDFAQVLEAIRGLETLVKGGDGND